MLAGQTISKAAKATRYTERAVSRLFVPAFFVTAFELLPLGALALDDFVAPELECRRLYTVVRGELVETALDQSRRLGSE